MAESCEAAVDQLLRRYGWRLLPRAAFILRARAQLDAVQAIGALRAAKFVYSEALYAACSGAEGAERQEQGYIELHRWLYDFAFVRYRDVAEIASQQALVLTYADFGRCSRPGTFLLFAQLQLRDAANRLRGQA